ncbi:3-deoxy-D-manno-octulosonate 8-phosphate phosphatase [Chryseobacterium shandongense]|uniref:3-deoxy-D-manno-octulosonate 8-phosphate phosphatase n=1 Tax=Chryseobacterium shandongense TaxID=1493872 RepID=A0AAD0YFC1_9FLAO|nr:HAD hydrolase family protein [Chryseobacterium shandongense]AZA87504.1 3-deoxy-D-manno-octulosonate 8-phosphate phosphatase [Chryseobacterium shandongense]AZA96005.1 3-deoxy-D-manno-octulosonate 8-phosphate phosphatase [Chryseobacterium shandongense]
MSYKEKLKNIKAFVFDVDGVFTDGSVYLLPGGNMCRVMNVLDGYAVVKALKNNYLIGVITGGNDDMVKHRINYLGIDDYYAKSHDKMADFEDFKKKHQLKNEEILTMGDDIPDLHIMQNSAIAACPENAVPEIKEIADYISTVKGGSGAVRDVIEQVMKAQGKWHDDNTQSV